MTKTKGCSARFLQLLALGAVAIFVLTLPPALFGRGLARVVFDPRTFSDVLRTQLLESGLVTSRMQEVFDSGRWLEALGDDAEPLRPAFEYLSNAEKAEILTLLLPDGWMQEQFNLLLQDFFAWVDSPEAVAQVAIDFQPLKAHLRTGGIDSIVEILVDSWPSCTAEGALRLERELLGGEAAPTEYCEPPEPMLSDLVRLASNSLIEQVNQLPERLQLFKGVDPAELLVFKDQLRSLRAISFWGWFLPLSMLGVVMALVARGLDDLRRWWGLSLMISGLSTFLFVLILNSARPDLAANLTRGFAGSGSLVQSVLVVGLQGLLSLALQRLLLQSLLLAIGGLAFWFGLRWIIRRRGAEAQEELPPALAASSKVNHPAGPPPVPPLDRGDGGGEGDPPSGIFG
jgi:hypothetical protein